MDLHTAADTSTRRLTIAPCSDHAAVRALLREAQLPADDLDEAHLEQFFTASVDGEPLGVVGVELYGVDALLRSLVVRPTSRSEGTGSKLLAHAEHHARQSGVATIYLLTTTAERFFAARGYARVERSSAPATIRATSEFALLCPAGAAFMMKQL